MPAKLSVSQVSCVCGGKGVGILPGDAPHQCRVREAGNLTGSHETPSPHGNPSRVPRGPASVPGCARSRSAAPPVSSRSAPSGAKITAARGLVSSRQSLPAAWLAVVERSSFDPSCAALRPSSASSLQACPATTEAGSSRGSREKTPSPHGSPPRVARRGLAIFRGSASSRSALPGTQITAARV